MNPGARNSKVLAAIAAEKVDTRHRELLDVFHELKDNQEALAHKVSDVTNQLTALEAIVENIECSRSEREITSIVAQAVQRQNVSVQSRLDDLEDLSRRDNPLFYDIPETAYLKLGPNLKAVCVNCFQNSVTCRCPLAIFLKHLD